MRLTGQSLHIIYVLVFDDQCVSVDKTVDSILETAGPHRIEIVAINIGSYSSPLAESLRWKSRTETTYRPHWSIREAWQRGMDHVLEKHNPDFVALCRADFNPCPGFLNNIYRERTHYKVFVPHSNFYGDMFDLKTKSTSVTKNQGGFCFFVPASCARSINKFPPLNNHFVDHALMDLCAKWNYTVYKLGESFAYFTERSTSSPFQIENDHKVYEHFLTENKSYEQYLAEEPEDIYSGFYGG